MKRFEFRLSLSPQTCLDYYRGTIKQVRVQSDAGVTVQFPAALLTRFVTDTGVHGRFALTCDDNDRGAALQRLP
jgi:hypothetical protein